MAVERFNFSFNLLKLRERPFRWCVYFLSSLPPPLLVCIVCTDKLEQFESECNDLFTHFQSRNLEALVLSVRCTLEGLRRRITMVTSSRTPSKTYPLVVDETSRPAAAFLSQLVLSLPNIVMKPSLEEVQSAVNIAVCRVSEMGGSIPLWTPLHPQSNQSTPRSAASLSQSK